MNEFGRKIRVLLAKPGLDGHNQGIKIVARALRDAGMEVVYTGIRQTPQQIVQAALQEAVDIIGLSILSGAHMSLIEDIMHYLKENNSEEIPIIIGGIIPDKDVDLLEEMGVKKIFGPGASTSEIVSFIENQTEKKSKWFS